MLVPFALFLLLGLANLDEMDGAFGLWIALLVLSLATFLGLAVVIPAVSRTGQRKTRYAVTETHALIRRGTEVLRYPVAARFDVTPRPSRKGLMSVPFARAQVRSGPTAHNRQTWTAAFADLAEDEARAASAALKQVRGNGGDGGLERMRLR